MATTITYYVELVYPSGERVRLNTIPTRGQAASQAAGWFRSRTDKGGQLPVSVSIGTKDA